MEPEAADEMVGPRGLIKKVEFVKIIAAGLHSLGYQRTKEALEEEAGFSLCSPEAILFRKHVLDGNWDESIATLHTFGFTDESSRKSASFLILEQKFLDLLEEDCFMDALMTLRKEITPLGINRERVHELARCIISKDHVSPGIIYRGMGNHRQLLDDLQEWLPPEVMIPERRLEHLVEQAVKAQIEASYFHNAPSLSLYADHHCKRDKIPSQTKQILHGHGDEVWFLQFSNNGKYLASSSKSGSVIIWKADEDGRFSPMHILTHHKKPVLMVSWSPDDCQLLSCELEGVICRWNSSSGTVISTYRSQLGMIACSWFPDGKHFYCCLADNRIMLLDLQGNEIRDWGSKRRTKFSDVAITKDRKIFVYFRHEADIALRYINEEYKRWVILEEQTIMSFSLSRDGRFLLVNLVDEEIHLWSIVDSPELVTIYTGHKCSRFLIRSCFGGYEQSLVASGSEDSQVYIWHRDSGNLIHALPGHAGAVNCVSWNPVNRRMLASASDDGTIHIWGIN